MILAFLSARRWNAVRLFLGSLMLFPSSAISQTPTGQTPKGQTRSEALSRPDTPETKDPASTNRREAAQNGADPKKSVPTIAPPQSSSPARRAIKPPRRPCAAGCLTPIEAVTYADNVAPRAGIFAEFDLIIRSVGEVQGRYYLNSETDYRERNCLSIVLTPNVAQALAGTMDLNALAVAMKGRRIAVQGVARRVRIDFTEDGKATGKYYYQVHVVVTDPRQIVMN